MLREQPRQLEGGIECTEISDPDRLVREPLVSVAMITYNHGPYLAQAIEGVLSQQTDFPVELVIGEDCSTDNTMAVARRYAEQRPDVIRILTSESNVGFRRNGLRVHWACRAKYLAYCEGDDYWHDPRKLQKQVDILEADEGVVLVHTDIDIYYQDKDIRTTRFNHRRGYRFDASLTPQQRFERLLFGQDVCYTPTVCTRRSLLDEIIRSDPHVFQSDYFPMGDIPRWLELSLRGRFAYLEQSTATLRRLSESASRSGDFSRLAMFTLKGIELKLYYKDRARVNDKQFSVALNQVAMHCLYRACLVSDAKVAQQLRAVMPQMNTTNRLLYLATTNKLLNLLLRGTFPVALWGRRLYRKAWYGIESSI